MLIAFTYKFIIFMLICCYYKTLKTNMSSNIFNCCVYRASADTLNDFTWTHCAAISLIPRGLYTLCCWLGWHFWHTHQTRENVSQTPLHTVSKKHIVQPGNHSKTLGTGVSLYVPLISTLLDALIVQNAPAHIENERLPATSKLSPPGVWTHS